VLLITERGKHQFVEILSHSSGIAPS